MTKQDSICRAFVNGYQDRASYGLLRAEQLYRRPRSRIVAWKLGWELANLLTRTPLRTAKR